MKLGELIFDENGLLVKLRCENYFDEADYAEIKKTIICEKTIWKEKGAVPVDDVISLIALIDQLAGGSRFFDHETSIKVEDACLEIEDIINSLLE